MEDLQWVGQHVSGAAYLAQTDQVAQKIRNAARYNEMLYEMLCAGEESSGAGKLASACKQLSERASPSVLPSQGLLVTQILHQKEEIEAGDQFTIGDDGLDASQSKHLASLDDVHVPASLTASLKGHMTADGKLNGSSSVTSTAESSAFMSWWVKCDRVMKSFAFYENGPGAAAHFHIDFTEGILAIPFEMDKELLAYVFNCRVPTESVHPDNAAAISQGTWFALVFKFQKTLDYFRWVSEMASVCRGVSYLVRPRGLLMPLTCQFGSNADGQQIVTGGGSTVTFMNDLTDVDDDIVNLYTSAEWPAKLLHVASAVVSSVSESRIARTCLRRVSLPGHLVKGCTFKHFNQRLVFEKAADTNSTDANDGLVSVPQGNKISSVKDVTGGSVMLSFNNLSAVTMHGSSVVKAIGNLPGHITVECAYWRFPRGSYTVKAVGKLATQTGTGGRSADTSNSNINKHFAIGVKGSSLFSSSVDKSVNPLEELFGASAQWSESTLHVTDGNALLTIKPTAPNLPVRQFNMQLRACQVKLVPNAHCKGALGLCLELMDADSHVLISHESLSHFMQVAEVVVQCMKLLGALPAPMASLYHQAETYQKDQDEV